MDFGIFDHLDRNDRPLTAFYEERPKLAEIYEAARSLELFVDHVMPAMAAKAAE